MLLFFFDYRDFFDAPSCSRVPLKPKNLNGEAKGTLHEVNASHVEDLTPQT